LDGVSSIDQDLSHTIAERVRELRAEHGLSMEALAEKSGVSRSMISLIERAETSATAVVLDRIAGALGCSITAFFERKNSPSNPLSRRDDQQTWRDPDSGYMRRMLSPTHFPTPLDLIEVTFPAGARVAYAATEGRELHQQIWIVSGAMVIDTEGVTYELNAGDCLATKVAAPIVYTNPHAKAARYLVALTSPANFSRRV
jgi:transcriptional regulator with XRE-family HTH domain